MDVGQVFNPYRIFVGAFIPNCLMEYKGISSTAKLCWARLAQYGGKDGDAFPSQETLAKQIGINKRQCVTVLALLEKEGFIKRIAPTGNAKWLHLTTRYLFLWHDVFAHSAQDCTSLRAEDCTQRESVKKVEPFSGLRVRTPTEYNEDYTSPDSTPGTELHKRIQEIGT